MSTTRKPMGVKAAARIQAQRRTRHAARRAVRTLGRSFTPRVSRRGRTTMM
jgi:hypothetical protein